MGKSWKLGDLPELRWIMSVQGIVCWRRKGGFIKLRTRRDGERETPRPAVIMLRKLRREGPMKPTTRSKAIIPVRTVRVLAGNSRLGFPYCSTEGCPWSCREEETGWYEAPAISVIYWSIGRNLSLVPIMMNAKLELQHPEEEPSHLGLFIDICFLNKIIVNKLALLY